MGVACDNGSNHSRWSRASQKRHPSLQAAPMRDTLMRLLRARPAGSKRNTLARKEIAPPPSSERPPNRCARLATLRLLKSQQSALMLKEGTKTGRTLARLTRHEISDSESFRSSLHPPIRRFELHRSLALGPIRSKGSTACPARMTTYHGC